MYKIHAFQLENVCWGKKNRSKNDKKLPLPPCDLAVIIETVTHPIGIQNLVGWCLVWELLSCVNLLREKRKTRNTRSSDSVSCMTAWGWGIFLFFLPSLVQFLCSGCECWSSFLSNNIQQMSYFVLFSGRLQAQILEPSEIHPCITE